MSERENNNTEKTEKEGGDGRPAGKRIVVVKEGKPSPTASQKSGEIVKNSIKGALRGGRKKPNLYRKERTETKLTAGLGLSSS